jgi:Tartrate dehydratase beta subunit/Fumarate hydratase class I, C-terminal domain
VGQWEDCQCVTSAELIAYEDLGTEEIRRLEVVDFPAVVVNDLYAHDLCGEGPRRWRRNAGRGGSPSTHCWSTSPARLSACSP